MLLTTTVGCPAVRPTGTSHERTHGRIQRHVRLSQSPKPMLREHFHTQTTGRTRQDANGRGLRHQPEQRHQADTLRRPVEPLRPRTTQAHRHCGQRAPAPPDEEAGASPQREPAHGELLAAESSSDEANLGPRRAPAGRALTMLTPHLRARKAGRPHRRLQDDARGP